MVFHIYQVFHTDKQLIQEIYEALLFLEQVYPNFSSWYNKKVIPGLKDGSRQIYIAGPFSEPDSVAAIMILKNDCDEKKISTLYVVEKYRSRGLGTRLVRLAIRALDCNFPIITVCETYKSVFDPFLRKFGFTHFEEYPSYYKVNVSEHSYNGYLNPGKKNDSLLS